MPLPKPSKIISKRFKKPKTLNPFINPPPPPSSALPFSHNHHKLWPHSPPQKWRVRVICTDPDATDDSSADEFDALASPRKRSIHEVFLPVIPPSLPLPSMPESPPRSRRRWRRSSCNSIAPFNKLCCDNCDAEVASEDMDALVDATSEASIRSASPSLTHHQSTVLSGRECEPAEVEFTEFLSEFVLDVGEKCMWEEMMGGLAMPQESEIVDLLNLELDSEALTWINSLQRLP